MKREARVFSHLIAEGHMSVFTVSKHRSRSKGSLGIKKGPTIHPKKRQIQIKKAFQEK